MSVNFVVDFKIYIYENKNKIIKIPNKSIDTFSLDVIPNIEHKIKKEQYSNLIPLSRKYLEKHY